MLQAVKRLLEQTMLRLTTPSPPLRGEGDGGVAFTAGVTAVLIPGNKKVGEGNG